MGKLPHTKDMPAPSAPAVPSNEITPYSIPPPQAPQSTTYNLGNQPATAYNVGCAPYNNPQTYVWAPQPHSSGPQQYGSPARPYGTATQQYSSAPQPYGMAQPFGKPHDGSYGSPYPVGAKKYLSELHTLGSLTFTYQAYGTRFRASSESVTYCAKIGQWLHHSFSISGTWVGFLSVGTAGQSSWNILKIL
eukprot:GHVT01063496.1.p1 GENE.GHVT01063496.1~~GHVT01063496.1.p1  ORF type:complete len:191 (+),score=3.36 GHVT01063496.1:354-926(+)